VSKTNKKRFFIGFLIINLIIFLGWLWSKDGAVMHVELRNNNGKIQLIVDGKQLISLIDRKLKQGKIGLGFYKNKTPATLVHPEAWDNLVVRDLGTGKILFEDNFNDGDFDWEIFTGRFKGEINKKGQLVSTKRMAAITGEPDWSAYSIEADLYNSIEADLFFNVQDKRNFAWVKFRNWREMVVTIEIRNNGKQTGRKSMGLTERSTENVKVILIRFIRSYAYGLAVTACATALFFLFTFLTAPFTLLYHRIFSHKPSSGVNE